MFLNTRNLKYSSPPSRGKNLDHRGPKSTFWGYNLIYPQRPKKSTPRGKKLIPRVQNSTTKNIKLTYQRPKFDYQSSYTPSTAQKSTFRSPILTLRDPNRLKVQKATPRCLQVILRGPNSTPRTQNRLSEAQN